MTPTARTPPFGIASALALVSGIGICMSLPGLPAWPWFIPLLVLGIGGWSLHFLQLPQFPHRIVGALLCGFALAGLHASVTLARQLPPTLEHRELTVTGHIVDLPQVEPQRTRFRLRVDNTASQPAPLRGRLLQLAWYDGFAHRHAKPASAPASPGFVPSARSRLAPGSRWRLTLKLRAPRGLRNPGGFDGERQALAQRITATGYVTAPVSARQLDQPQGIDAWRARMSSRIARDVASPSSRFVRALALGDTRGLDDIDWEQLRATGVTHLIAISGFHVGLVAGLFALLVSGLWRAWPTLGQWIPRPLAASTAAMLGALGYAGIAGFALPTVRTVLMIAIVVAARLARRAQRAVDALALAAIAILLVDPLSVLAPGFWLSFAGVAWLLWCLPHASAETWRARLRGFLDAQAVATIGLLPLAAVLFGQASLAGPLANVIAIPWWSLVVVPLSLIGTALEVLHAGWGGFGWTPAAWCFDLAWPLFQWLAASPLSLWWLPQAPWFAFPLAVCGGFWLLLPRGVHGKPLALLLWLPLLYPQRDLPRAGEVDLQVIDVGQGLAVLVRTAHHTLLYDTGPAIADGFDAGESAVVPTLHALGVRHLDVIVISHGDNDHAGGFAAVVRSFPPVVALTPDGAPPLPQERACLAGAHWRWDDVQLRFLHPTAYFPYLGNEAGCVLRIQSRHGTVLLPADIGEVIEQRLLHRDARDLRADVVLMPHHGSAGSSSPDFVMATHARFAIASSGHDNRFRHPRPQVVTRWQATGARVLNTADTGAVQVRLRAGGIQVLPLRQGQPRLWDAAKRRLRVIEAGQH